MATASAFLDNVYEADGGESMRRYYDRWADSYDADLRENDYRTPSRCAAALSDHLADKNAPILDFACGTGISGVALKEAGFETIDGTDISEGMLEKARAKGIYRDLLRADPDAVLDIGDRQYMAITAVGAIGAGAAPAENIDAAIASLAPGGIFVVSLNDHTLEDKQYEAKLNQAIADGRVEKIMAEDGPHLPAIGLGARVWAVRRL
ncbi:class I SAM-dependent DNA methyltransferase [Chelativorans sp. YIM 93263]|uniref:class I SAM-dependent DNA methyltransferase n=1 Tax=Chelativorans sp. YIM 93263 TaxID=2906648 RepID=UPI002378B9E9|nr:methyltransferase domain-containing protein [Chelativorans sp. YIM 93263]